MRGLLTLFFILFLTKSSFAVKPGYAGPVLQKGKEKSTSVFKNIFEKVHPEDGSNFTGNDFEHPTLIQFSLKKHSAAPTVLLLRTVHKPILQDPLIKTYVLTGNYHHQFIYHFLYPKHVFW